MISNKTRASRAPKTAQRTPTPDVTRRHLLHGLGLALTAVPLAQLLACSSSGEGDTTSGADGGTGGAGGAKADATSGADAAAENAATRDGAGWATGGTASMSGTYADPFTTGLGSACALTCAATLGPCYAATVERTDISEGHDGLPVRLAFLLVDESCTPIEGATVDIWHVAPEGLYSGDDASDFCTSGDASARAARWFRGVQTSDSKGRVNFDTCFPGWYSSRTIHIHFTVRINGAEYVTSQLFFDDALDDEIVGTQPLYNTRGPRDTTNQTDSVVSASSVADYTFQTARMADGAMLAWKTLVIRSSTSSALCDIPGGSGGPGGGGGGPGGPFGEGGPMGSPPGDR
jgi:protocatechuate 3,4-dioxygenase beta subunit